MFFNNYKLLNTIKYVDMKALKFQQKIQYEIWKDGIEIKALSCMQTTDVAPPQKNYKSFYIELTKKRSCTVVVL